MPVEIVPIEEKHIEGFDQCVASVARERRWLGFFEGFPEGAARDFVMSMIENDNPQFVVLDGETVVGWIDITPSRREISPHVGTLGMGLHQDYRRQGLGTRLMRVALDKAIAKGIQRIELEVFAHNTRAIKLYEKFGFQHEGRKVRSALLDEGYADVLFMALWIGDEE